MYRNDGDLRCYEGGLLRVAGRNKDLFNLAVRRGFDKLNNASDGPNIAIQRQFADKSAFLEVFWQELAGIG